MFRRDDFQFFAITLGFAMLLHTCDGLAAHAFKGWAAKYNTTASVREMDAQEIISKRINAPVPLPRKVKQIKALVSDAERKTLCKRGPECSKLAEALVYEARGESLQGAIAVGYVIVQRTKNPTRWPKTIRGVIAQKNQFSYTKRRQAVKPKQEDWDRAYIASYQIMREEVRNPIGKSDHYHTTKVRPKWAKKMQYVATVGSHKFYRDVN